MRRINAMATLKTEEEEILVPRQDEIDEVNKRLDALRYLPV